MAQFLGRIIFAVLLFVGECYGQTIQSPNTWVALQQFNGGATVPTLSCADNSTNVASTAFALSCGGGSAATFLNNAPQFTTACNPTGVTAAAQWCPAVTAVLPLSISTGGSPQISLNFGVGTANTFLNNAGNLTTSGTGNSVGLGLFSLLNQSTGFRNIGIGPSSLQADTTGGSNICLGFSCLSSLTTGSNNFVAASVGVTNATTAANTVGIGSGVLGTLTTGTNNLSFGANSCSGVTTGGTNTCIGNQTAALTMTTTSAVTLASSTTVTLNGNDTANSLQTGMLVTGTGIPAGTTVTGCACSGTTFAISNAATITGAGSVITFTASSDPNRYTVNSNAASSVGNANSTITLDGTAGTGTISGLHLLVGMIATDGGVKIPANAVITALNADNVTITINNTTGAGPTAEVVTFTNPAGGVGILTGSNNTIFGNCTGLVFNAANQFAFCDGAANLRLDYSKTTASFWTLYGATASTGGFIINPTTAATTATSGALQVKGGAGIAGAAYVGGGLFGTLATAVGTNAVCNTPGTTTQLTVQVWATGCAASSARFKQDIKSVDGMAALDVVSGMLPVTYHYRPETNMGSDIHFGFTAEQVATVDPDLVTYEDDGVTPHAVKYNEMAPLFAGAIRRLKADNDNLRAANDNLRERLERLERRMAQ